MLYSDICLVLLTRVATIMANSSVSKHSGTRIKVGDEVLEINGHDMEFVSLETAQ